jgi:argininosuccinate lyase
MQRALVFSGLAVFFGVLTSAGVAAQPRDQFYWLGEINKASAVMAVEQDIVPRELGQKIAAAVAKVIADGNAPGARRSGDYLVVEQSLMAEGGPDVSRIHSGRSRQDLGATFRRLFERDDLLASFEALIQARETLVTLAEAHRDAIVPAYTWGVQAQPISLGHYLGGYVQALTRDADRYREAWARVNQSPLGSAALGTSSFPVNRVRLAALLGFDGNVENSFDANQISPVDTGIELVSVASSSALTIGMLAADITAQYAQTRPWLLLTEGTGTSSIMPQKRNPTALVGVRTAASTLVGEAMTFSLQAHNVMEGMGDYKGELPNRVLRGAAALYTDLAALMKSFTFDPARALDEVNREYSTTTELADTLQRVADVPFRVGHHFASELVNFGRSHDLRPAQIPYGEAQRIFIEAARSFKMTSDRLPLTEAQFRRSLTAENMVQAAQVLGGPQPAEVARMLAAQRTRLAADREWLRTTRAGLERATVSRDAAFASLQPGR